MKDEQFSILGWQRMNTWANNRPHSSRGFSSETKNKCIGAKLLRHFLNIPFEGNARTIPGTLIHEFNQNDIYPMGATVHEGKFEIIAHEVPVFLMINGEMRWSYIDTLVWNNWENCLEVWDYKSHAYAASQKEEAKPAHIDQVNLYGYLYPAKYCRVIYNDKSAFDNQPCHVFPIDERMALDYIERMQLIDDLMNGRIEVPWHELTIEELQKDSTKRECKYCLFRAAREWNGKLYPSPCIGKYNEEYKQDFKDLRAIKTFLKKQGVITVEV